MDPEQRAEEQAGNTAYRQMRRMDPEKHSKEQTADTKRRRKQRVDPEESQVRILMEEQSRDTPRKRQRRSDPDVRKEEQSRDTPRKRQRRSDPDVRKEEQSRDTPRKKQTRTDPQRRAAERAADKQRRQARRSDQDILNRECARRQISNYGATLDESKQIFLDLMKDGPIYVCTSCKQTMFQDDVDDVTRLRPGQHADRLKECCTGYISVGGKEWLCHSCKREIYQDLYPKLAEINKVGFPAKPPELDLNPLEETLIAVYLPFMKIRSLPVGGLVAEGQKLIVGNVVHVPNDITSTVEVLPRNLDNMGVIAVKLKRKKSYKHSVFQENIRPTKVITALKYLVDHSELYKKLEMQMDPDTWLEELQNSQSENRFFVEGHQPPLPEDDPNTDEPMELPPAEPAAEDPSANDQHGQCSSQTTEHDDEPFEEVNLDEVTQGNLDTLLEERDPVQVYQEADLQASMMEKEDLLGEDNQVYNLAPGEGQIPVFRDPLAEYKCFPTIFCGQERPKNETRLRDVYESDLFKAELRHVDPRVCLNIPNIFWKAKHLQIKHVISKSHLALRRFMGPKHRQVTAKDMLDPTIRDTIRRLDEGYRIFRDVRNSPPYFEHKKKEVNAMVRQLGYPTLFFSLSSADTRWDPLIHTLGLLVDKQDYSDHYIKAEMSFQDKARLVASHPAVCSRYFHQRVKHFMKIIVQGPHSPFGKVKDFFYRVEFQKRGSPHIHGFLWVANAPDITSASPEEICNYVDSYISCSGEVAEEDQPYVGFQKHSHSRSCRRMQKDKPTCRFGAPWPPMRHTQILEPLDDREDIDAAALHKQFTRIMKTSNKLPEDVLSFDDWLKHHEVDEERYILMVRSSIEHRKLFLKRRPQDTRINAYMKELLGVWRANHDVQFVLNPFHCVSYICDYMVKSQKGISQLMQAANEEAHDGNMDLKQSVRHIGNKFINAAESPVQQCCYDILQLPITNSTRKKEYIHTNPPETRVGLVKSMKQLEEMQPNSKDVMMLSNIDRYRMRPRFLENWCLADYVAKTEIQYIKSKRSKVNQDEPMHDAEQLEACDEDEQHEEQGQFPYELPSGHILHLRRHDKVLRFRRYSLKTDPENYFRERLLLYLPWRKESALQGEHPTYADAFQAHEERMKANIAKYETLSSDLEAAYEEFYETQRNIDLFDGVATQEDDGEDPVALDDLPVLPPDDDSQLFRVDIGSALGIPPTLTEQDHAETLPLELSNAEYYELLHKLNRKQQEFHTHIMQAAVEKKSQVLCVLHGGAGTGKSTVIRAISEGLQRILRKQAGQDFGGTCLLIAAPTGKAAYNVNGQTLHRAFFIPASQKLEFRALKWDSLSSIRSNFHGVEWVLIDEFSMVGKRMLQFLHQRLQEIRSNQQPFGGMNIILVGDLHQLQPVKDGWIFEDLGGPYGALAPNIFKENFKLFELEEIMRQREDKTFAEALNRLRSASQTPADLKLFQTRLITEAQALAMPDVPHFYTTNVKKDAYNDAIMQQTEGRSLTITSKDTVTSDLPKRERNKALAAAKTKPVSGAGNLPHELTLKEGVRYDITANIDPNDGLVNGAECTVRHIEEPRENYLPICIWVEFSDQKIGKRLRSRVKQSHSHHTSKGRTPIQPISRQFVASQNNYPVSREQFPLQMSSGRTIHKAQSATHSQVVVDMSGPPRCPSHFYEHMHYVAFSRSETLQGLHIIDINEEKIRASPKVINYLQNERKLLELQYSPIYNNQCCLAVGYNNVTSLPFKWPALQTNHNLLACDVIILAETWLHQAHSTTSFQLDGFTQFRKDSTCKPRRRGLMMFIKETADVSSHSSRESPHLAMISCNLKIDGHDWNIVGLYKPPQTSYTHLMDELEVCASQLDMTKPTIFIGDLNVDITEARNNKFTSDMLQRFNLQLIGQGPTTWEGTHIDVIFTNQPGVCGSSVAATWTQHHCIFGTVPLTG